jgi:hypothetical protein
MCGRAGAPACPPCFQGERGATVRTYCAVALALAAIAAFGGPAPSAADDVTVCVANDAAAQWQLIAAEALAGELFDGIGVHVVWTHSRSGAAAFVRVVDWRAGHPTDELAYVEAYSASPRPVVIFFRSVKAAAGRESLVTRLLGHVLCHELAHALSGVDAHSPEGVMKARWSLRDLRQMEHAPLRFMSYDATRVRAGLERLSPGMKARRAAASGGSEH